MSAFGVFNMTVLLLYTFWIPFGAEILRLSKIWARAKSITCRGPLIIVCIIKVQSIFRWAENLLNLGKFCYHLGNQVALGMGNTFHQEYCTKIKNEHDLCNIKAWECTILAQCGILTYIITLPCWYHDGDRVSLLIRKK